MPLRVDRLRALREHKGWSQRELARRCELGETMIGKYENLIAEPTTSSLKQIAQALEVSADYLLGLSDEPRGHVGDGEFNSEEQIVVNTLRKEGWPGVFRLGAERIAK